MFLVYIIISGNRSYIGMTNNFLRRWMQHNRLLKGGPKYTSKYTNWSPICIIDGFKSKSEAMQCEWRLKRVKGYYNRIKLLSNIINNKERLTSKSPLIKDQNITLYCIDKFRSLFNNINIKELAWF